MNCALCGEVFEGAYDLDRPPIHKECGLRSALGGIGHLIAHEYWCMEFNDPDAGLSFRHSAKLVDCYVSLVGVEQAVEMSAWPLDD